MQGTGRCSSRPPGANPADEVQGGEPAHVPGGRRPGADVRRARAWSPPRVAASALARMEMSL